MKDLTTGRESGLIFRFAMPMLIANLFQQTYTFADLAIIGNSHIGEAGIAAITNAFHIIFSMIALIIGISVGFNIVVAQYFGAKQMDKVKRTVDTIVVFLLVASLITTIGGISLSGSLFGLIKVPPDVLPMAKSYIHWYFAGAISFFGFHGVSAILRGLGDSKTPLYFMIISSVMNIILDWFFIIYLGLDIQWAAIATIIAQGSVFIASVFYLNKTHKIIHFSFARLRFDKEIFKKSMAIGLPSGIQATLVGLSMVGLMWIINPFGKAVTAAFGAASRIDALASLPAMNFAAALATFVGQNMGANRPGRVKKGLIATWLMTTVVSVTVTVIVILFNKQLIGLFAETEEMIAIGSDYLIIVSSFYAVFTTMFIIGGVMRGAGDTLIPMFITLFAVWVVRLPVAWLLSRTSLGVHGIWWAIPIGWATGMTLVCLYYSTGRWKKKVIVRPAIVEEPA